MGLEWREEASMCDLLERGALDLLLLLQECFRRFYLGLIFLYREYQSCVHLQQENYLSRMMKMNQQN